MKTTTKLTTKLFFAAFTLLFSANVFAQSYPEMITVEGGEFTMGTRFTKDSEALPRHKVKVSTFKISKTEVTVAQYRTFYNETGKDMPFNWNWEEWQDDHPITKISWEDAVAYTKWLSDKFNKNYRLPTEAEWEFAARGGNKSKGYKYSGSNNLKKVAWYEDNSDGNIHPVAQKLPNELGIYDMNGNVAEFCSDWFDENYYAESLKDNPKGPVAPPEEDLGHVVRGKDYKGGAKEDFVAGRDHEVGRSGGFIFFYQNHGIRVVLSE